MEPVPARELVPFVTDNKVKTNERYKRFRFDKNKVGFSG